MKVAGEIVVSYGGTHQAFYQALAAQETGQLKAFLCSIYNARGKWGARLAKVVGNETLKNRSIEGFDSSLAVEHPWPFLISRTLERFGKVGDWDWLWMTNQVDRWSATWLEKHPCKLLVASETGAYHSFRVAKRQDAHCILDCPQAHPNFLAGLLGRAADDLGMPPPPPVDRPDVADRKAGEFEMADHLLMISELQADTFQAAGFPREKMSVIPLGIDFGFWNGGATDPKVPRKREDPLRVLFVGGVDLRKGIPYLLRACEVLGSAVELWLVGNNGGTVNRFLEKSKAVVKLLGRKTKEELREIYHEADIFVLPSLIDTFGYVAMEAMACGKPVIVSENCGVPVPDVSWRVPIMDSVAIAERLRYYIKHSDEIEIHGKTAVDFARQFTRDRYRSQIKELFQRILCSGV